MEVLWGEGQSAATGRAQRDSCVLWQEQAPSHLHLIFLASSTVRELRTLLFKATLCVVLGYGSQRTDAPAMRYTFHATTRGQCLTAGSAPAAANRRESVSTLATSYTFHLKVYNCCALVEYFLTCTMCLPASFEAHLVLLSSHTQGWESAGWNAPTVSPLARTYTFFFKFFFF